MQEGSPEKTSVHDPLEDQEGGSRQEGEEEEEEETCGFCIFMKGGGCKDAFEVCLGTSFSQECVFVCRRHEMLQTANYFAGME